LRNKKASAAAKAFSSVQYLFAAAMHMHNLFIKHFYFPKRTDGIKIALPVWQRIF